MVSRAVAGIKHPFPWGKYWYERELIIDITAGLAYHLEKCLSKELHFKNPTYQKLPFQTDLIEFISKILLYFC